MATKKSDAAPRPMSLSTYTNLVGRKAHPPADLTAFGRAYRKGHDDKPEEFPKIQTRQDWEYSFAAWLQLRDLATALETAPEVAPPETEH